MVTLPAIDKFGFVIFLRTSRHFATAVPNINPNISQNQMAATFQSTFDQFVEELEVTFPELADGIKAAKAFPKEHLIKQFRVLYRGKAMLVAVRDDAFFEADVELLPGVRMTPKLWGEISKTTKNAIWNYLSSLILLSAADSSTEEDTFWNDEEFKKSMENMMAGLKQAAGAAGGGSGASGAAGDANPFAAFGDMGGIFTKLREMAESFSSAGASGAAAGGSGAAGGLPEFKLPERMFKGHIAKMARELAEEFKPEEFGISPELLNSQDPAKVFEYLQELFTKNPEKLMGAAQRIAKKLQTKFLRGEIRREEIISEVEELMKEFSENEAFKSIFGNLGELLQMSAKATGNEGSERRRAVQERLRKKAAEKEAKKTTSASTDLVALAAADAVAAALLAEEDAKKKKAGKKH